MSWVDHISRCWVEQRSNNHLGALLLLLLLLLLILPATLNTNTNTNTGYHTIFTRRAVKERKCPAHQSSQVCTSADKKNIPPLLHADSLDPSSSLLRTNIRPSSHPLQINTTQKTQLTYLIQYRRETQCLGRSLVCKTLQEGVRDRL